MKLLDTLFQKKLQKEMQKMGLSGKDIDPGSLGMSSENLMQIGAKLKEIISQDPALKNLDLTNISTLMQHKDALRRLFEKNKKEIQELMTTIKKE